MIVLALASALISAEPMGTWLIGRSRGFRQKALLYSGFERASLDAIESDSRWAGILRKKAKDTSDRASAARWLQRAEEFSRDVVTDQRLGLLRPDEAKVRARGLVPLAPRGARPSPAGMNSVVRKR